MSIHLIAGSILSVVYGHILDMLFNERRVGVAAKSVHPSVTQPALGPLAWCICTCVCFCIPISRHHYHSCCCTPINNMCASAALISSLLVASPRDTKGLMTFLPVSLITKDPTSSWLELQIRLLRGGGSGRGFMVWHGEALIFNVAMEIQGMYTTTRKMILDWAN